MIKKSFAASLIQFDCPDDKTGAVAVIQKKVEEAAASRPDLVLLAEVPYTPYTTVEDFRPVAEPIPGPFCERLSGLAKKHGVFLCSGIVEREVGFTELIRAGNPSCVRTAGRRNPRRSGMTKRTGLSFVTIIPPSLTMTLLTRLKGLGRSERRSEPPLRSGPAGHSNLHICLAVCSCVSTVDIASMGTRSTA